MGVDHELSEAFAQVASDLDRVTSELQIGVMKTRMQPLSKLFNRYPRLIRDLSRSTGKEIDLKIIGGETEVDKSVLELLGDPLVHILRNSADHGVEMPEERLAAGKPAMGTIAIEAGHEGNHVVVRIMDDGRGLNAETIAKKAVEKGLATQDEIAGMPKSNIYKFIFEAGFSTARQVTDLSGRGVGMDVVRTNIAKLNGVVDVASDEGRGTTVSIRIPLTVAIMQAMMVCVDEAIYAIPLSNILEIVKPDAGQLYTIHGHKVMRLRDSVLPLISLSDMFASHSSTDGDPVYAVIVGLGSETAGLMVHDLIGQEEVVIKPLDTMFDQTHLVSGATVREDGGVSLILDISAMMKAAS
jgi:two-component system chemotaxis sensor kinase CheA